MHSTLACLALLALAVPEGSAPEAALATKPAKRPFQIDDFFRAQAFAWSIAPDGQTILYASHTYPHPSFDVWLWPKDGKAPHVVFPGEKEGLHYAQFVWSPDCRYLALRVEKGALFQIQVWERASGKKIALTPFYLQYRPDSVIQELHWISDHQMAA